MSEVKEEEILVSKSIDDLPEIAASIISFSKNFRIWLFFGEMGAGKTTLIKHICSQLKVDEIVSSPTYSIVNEYRNNEGEKIYHFDFYRIRSETEAMDIGYEDYFFSGDLCLVEWPEKIPNLLPDRYIKIEIKMLEDLSRVIHLSRHE